jgi:hypothetical protein
MEILIKRTYGTNGTNGELLVNGQKVCHSIELPWLDNMTRKSCIPEGSYPLVKRTSQKYKRHLLVQNVPGRSLILIHPANTALTELAGCIAPVTTLAGEGRGLRSRLAFEKVRDMAYAAIDRAETVTLIITS